MAETVPSRSYRTTRARRARLQPPCGAPKAEVADGEDNNDHKMVDTRGDEFVVLLSQHRMCQNPLREAVKIQAAPAVFAAPYTPGPRTTRGRLAVRRSTKPEHEEDAEAKARVCPVLPVFSPSQTAGAKSEEAQEALALSQPAVVVALPRVYGPRTTHGRRAAAARLLMVKREEDCEDQAEQESHLRLRPRHSHCFFLDDANPQEEDRPSGRKRKRADPAAPGMAKAARVACDAAMVTAQLLDVAPDAVAGSQGRVPACERLCALTERFLVDSGCFDASCHLLFGQCHNTSRPTTDRVWTVALATEYLLAARLRFTRLVAGWRAFFCGGVEGEALLRVPAVRQVLRFNVALSRLDPHLPRITRKVAAMLLGVIIGACGSTDEWLREKLRQAASRCALSHCREVLHASSMVAATVRAVLSVQYEREIPDLVFVRAWCQLQDHLNDRDMKGVPFIHKADAAFDEMYFVDPDTLAISYLRPLFPKNKATGLEIREAVERGLA